MSVIAIGSFRGSPGATTVAFGLATVWTMSGRRSLVVEADPDGGVLAARCGLGHRPCLTDLAVKARGGAEPDAIWEHGQVSRRGVPVLVGHPSPDQCHATLRTGATRIAELINAVTEDNVIVDVGRLRPGSPAEPLVEAAELVVIVLRPRLEEVDGVAPRLAALPPNIGLVLVGDRPHRPAEVADALGVGVLGVLPEDDRGALGLTNGTGRADRRPFMRAAAHLANQVAGHLDRLRQ
jgi:hypothetical protein